MELSTVEEAIEELRAGKLILCIDDPDRENEGDMIFSNPKLKLKDDEFKAIADSIRAEFLKL